MERIIVLNDIVKVLLDYGCKRIDVTERQDPKLVTTEVTVKTDKYIDYNTRVTMKLKSSILLSYKFGKIPWWKNRLRNIQVRTIFR